ncbi:MAG: EAL domain-containing protein [Terracidiphilus sp.]|jgi:PAS domain S-box-containing protein
MVSLEGEILRAFGEGEFFPVFQPLVELRTGKLIGFEALARWRHKTLGDIAPDGFIPLLEKNGLVDRLSIFIVETALASPAFKDNALTLSINMSPRQLLNYQSSERLQAAAARNGFDLSRLTVEITESALFDDLERAQIVAEELKEMSCSIALDDFGTGYSSLKHLQALPFDELKVDRSFVRSMTEKRDSRKIVAAVLGLGQSLGLTTVAEGVETQQQADMLLWLGCDVGQGWLYGKPCPVDELPEMASRSWPGASVVMPMPLGADSITRPDVPPEQRLAQLQAFYEGVPVGLCFLDREMRYVSLNRRFSEINGVPATEHLGRTVAEVVPHVFPLVEPHIRRALQGEPVRGVEVTKPPREGQPKPQTILLSYQPARDEGGEVLGVCVAIMDVSEIRRTEQALQETEDHYRHMMRLGPHVPWVLNAKGEVIDAGHRWVDLTGQPESEAFGNGWLKMLHPDDIGLTQEAIRKTLDTGSPMDIEYRIRRPSGEWTRMRSRGSPRFGGGGEITHVYGAVEEIESEPQPEVESQALESA